MNKKQNAKKRDLEAKLFLSLLHLKEEKSKDYSFEECEKNIVYLFDSYENFKNYFLQNGFVNISDDLLDLCRIKTTKKGTIIALKSLCDYVIRKHTSTLSHTIDSTIKAKEQENNYNISNNIVDTEISEMLQRVLFPLFQILDEKNITQGIFIKKENDKLYICLDRNCLSKTNQLILEKISYIYSETLFYSDDIQSPNADRLEYWCPDEAYDKRTNITQKCRNKKMFVLELDSNDEFTILGTSIMLANTLLEQDPIQLKVNEDLTVFDDDIMKRHEHYISSGCPDLKWINLSIILNNDNPIAKNPYAPFISECGINSSVSCDNMILSTFLGYNDKTYITFCMNKEELEKTIKEYYERSLNTDRECNTKLNEVQRKLLEK